MSDSIDEIISLLSNIREVTFRAPPTGLVGDALAELKEGQIDITLLDPPRRNPRKKQTFHGLFELSEEGWSSNIVSVSLHSDCLIDIRELECFPRIRELQLDTGLVEIDSSALTEAQRVIDDMKDLQCLTVYVDEKIESEVGNYLLFPSKKFSYSISSNHLSRKAQMKVSV